MRLLFACSLGGTGHLRPLLPFLAAARSRGDEVMVAIPPAMVAQVAEAGYPYHPCGEPAEDELAPLRELLPTLPPGQATLVGNRDLFGRLAAGAMLPGMERLVADWAPDLVVREPCEYASAIVAERSRLPHVQVAISPASAEMASIRAAERALEEHMAGLTDAIAASAYLTRFPASLDPSPFARTLRYREPSLAVGSRDPRPDWWGGAGQSSGGEVPSVYMTFGTVLGFMTIARQVFETALAAVGGMAVRVLLTFGRRFGIGELGELPPNVHAEPWVDQDLVLPHADLVVCHGGSGTVLGALAAGVPMVVVPSFADQFRNGRQVEAAGAGLTVEAAPAAAVCGGGGRSPVGPQDVPRIAAAVSEVLGSASYRKAARRIGDEMAASPSAASTLGDLAPARSAEGSG